MTLADEDAETFFMIMLVSCDVVADADIGDVVNDFPDLLFLWQNVYSWTNCLWFLYQVSSLWMAWSMFCQTVQVLKNRCWVICKEPRTFIFIICSRWSISRDGWWLNISLKPVVHHNNNKNTTFNASLKHSGVEMSIFAKPAFSYILSWNPNIPNTRPGNLPAPNMWPTDRRSSSEEMSPGG